MAFTLDDLWSRQKFIVSCPSISPAASLAAWSVTGDVNSMGKPSDSDCSIIRWRQSVWISPERYTCQFMSAFFLYLFGPEAGVYLGDDYIKRWPRTCS